MVPPVSGDTEILDTPEWWMGKGFDEIVDFRTAYFAVTARPTCLMLTREADD